VIIDWANQLDAMVLPFNYDVANKFILCRNFSSFTMQKEPSQMKVVRQDQRNGDLVRRTKSLGLHGEVQNTEQKLRGISGETEAVHRAGFDGVSNTKVAIGTFT
jgi:hypothetical protein